MKPAPVDNRLRTVFISVLLLLTVLRLLVAAVLPLAVDEAYYWTWSRHLAWGYPDHPPLIAAVIRMTTMLAGQTPLGVRLGPILFSLGTSLLLFFLGRELFDPTTGLVAALTYQVIPIFALGAIFAAPDAPMGFFWLLTVWFIWRALSRGHLAEWLAAGLSLGLAITSKLPALVLGISIAGFLLATPAARSWLRRIAPYAMAATTLATIAPVVWWNATHRWLVLLKARESVPWIMLSSPILDALAFLGAQLLYYGPLTLPLLLVAMWTTVLSARRPNPQFALVAWAALPIIGLTWVGSFNGVPKPHWPAPGYLVALLAGAALWVSASRPLTRWYGAVALGVNAVLIGAVSLSFVVSTSPETTAFRGWDQVAARLAPLVDQTPSSPGVFVLANEYQTASEIAFQLQERYLITTTNEDTAFGVRNDPQQLIDWNAVYINDLASGPGVPLAQLFQKVEPLPPIDVTINGRVVKRFAVYRGFGFRGLPTPPLTPF